MFASAKVKEPGPLITLNGYTFLSCPPVQNSQNLLENFPSPNIIALHQQTHEEFIVSKIPKANLNSQHYILIGNELRIGHQLKGLSSIRILCDVVDFEDHLFLFYSSNNQKSPHLDNLSKSQQNNPQNEITLLDYLRQVKNVDEEEEGRLIFGQIVKALMDCHERMVVHRDFKLPAVFINPVTKRVRIGDFSQATILERNGQLMNDRKGSPAYVSPEILIGKPYQPMHADYWALGVILYTMLSGTFPFLDASPRQVFDKILHGQVFYPSQLSLSSCQLIKGLLKSDPNQRFNGNHVLNHNWFKGGDDNDNDNDDQMVPEFD